jgi:tRNA-2-methylthio-N6-dimethylallyladenosine synthase
MEPLQVPVVSYTDSLASFMAGAGFALAPDGVWRNPDGESFAQHLTRAPRPAYHARTWGCQMNERDSEVLAGQLAALGYAPAAAEADADVILLNTCAIRGTAAEHALGEVGRLKALKARRPDLKLGVCGCLPQMPETVAHLRRHAPHVDLVFGTHNLHELPRLLRRAYEDEGQVVDVWRQSPSVVEDLPSARAAGVRAWVNIIHGCDKYCTYCIVPYTRGRERSRRPGDVLAEVERLAERGVREVTLLGQNVNSYGRDLEGGYVFADLLRDLDRVRGIRWIRYLTSHPRDFDARLVDVIAGSEKVCEHFHLPVQSGSDRVLRWMNRGYTRAGYLDLVRRIRAAVPDAAITTDIIVGFPRETEEDFLQTLELVAEVGYDNAFTFAYSPRPGTPAARWDDPVPDGVKKERLQRLNELQYAIGRRRNERLVGRRFEALVEGPSRKDPAVFTARTRANKLVHLPAAGLRPDEFRTVRITAAHTWTLDGEVAGGPRAGSDRPADGATGAA